MVEEFSQVAVQLHGPTAVFKSPTHSWFLPILGVARDFSFQPPRGKEMLSPCGFSSMSLMINDV